MKSRFILFVFLLLCFTELNAQTGSVDGTVVPLKPQSPLFGKDIVIHDSSSQNQRHAAICSAFNGWLYAVYSYFNIPWQGQAFEILKSVDNGITWNEIFDGPGVLNECLSLDIVAIGDSISNIKVFVAFVLTNSSPGYPGQGWLIDLMV